MTAGLAGMLKATGNLLGMRVRAATALAAVISGPVIALAHLAVYDALAVAFVGGAFWAMTEFLRRDHRGWLAAAALLYALAGLAKYPALMFAGPPLAALVVVERGRRARLDLGLAAFIVCAVLLVYFLSDRAQLAAFEAFRTQNNPNFHVGRNQIVYSQIYFTAVPLLLALVGTAVIENRRLALALLTGLIGAPVYHLLTGNPSGDQKHVVFGLLFILPLIGVTISHALYRWRSAVAVPVLVALGVFGLVQVTRIDEGWGDLRGSVEILTRDVRPGEKLLASSSWVEAAYLYDSGRIASPNDVYDVYRVQHLGKPFNACDFDWFIEVPGGEPWPPAIRRAIQRCGFRKVYESSATLTGLGSNLRFVTYRAPIEIWERRRGGGSASATDALGQDQGWEVTLNKIIERDRRARCAGIALVLTGGVVSAVAVRTHRHLEAVGERALPRGDVDGGGRIARFRWSTAGSVPCRCAAPCRSARSPRVAVIIPTLGEPLELLEATVRSVLEQDWPEERLWIVVSDDGHDERVKALVAGSPWPIAGRPCVTTARHDRVTRAAAERRRPATSIRHSHAFRGEHRVRRDTRR